MKKKFSKTPHYLIAGGVLIAAAIGFYFSIKNSAESSVSSQSQSISANEWYNGDFSLISRGRFGYSALINALKSKFELTHHFLPWYPDTDSSGKVNSSEKTSIIIHNPTRKWNRIESGELLKYVSRGGKAFIITSDYDSFINTDNFMKELGIRMNKAVNADYRNIYLVNPVMFYPGNKNSEKLKPVLLRVDRHIASLRLLRDKPFEVLLEDESGLSALVRISKREWNGGCVYWLFSVLPCFNGEKRDLVFDDKDLVELLGEKGIHNGIIDKYKKKEDIVKINNAADIPGQGTALVINTGAEFIEKMFGVLSAEERSICVFEHLISGTDSSITVFSSSSFYAIAVCVFYILLGIAFYVRQKIPLEILRKAKNESGIKRSEFSIVEPYIKNDAKARFAAQYLFVEKKLKRRFKEKQ